MRRSRSGLTAEAASSGVSVLFEEHWVAVRHGAIVIMVTQVKQNSVDRTITESVTHTAYEKVARQW
jgi:hypothetical protein